MLLGRTRNKGKCPTEVATRHHCGSARILSHVIWAVTDVAKSQMPYEALAIHEIYQPIWMAGSFFDQFRRMKGDQTS